MNPAYSGIFLVVLFLLLSEQGRRRNITAMRRILQKRKEHHPMTEMLERYIGKECIVYTMNSQVGGTVKEISDGWIMVDNGKDVEAINADYVLRVRECPRKKNGKKKLVID